MSNLSYLARTNLEPAPKKIHLPADTASPIMEEDDDDASGSDEETET
jgi:hypothetical protein